MIRTTLRDLAPWFVLLAVVVAGVAGKVLGADAAYWQLLSGVAGICGGAVVARKSDPIPVTTPVSANPPTVRTEPAQ